MNTKNKQKPLHNQIAHIDQKPIFLSACTSENPIGEKDGPDFKTYLNPESLETLTSCRVEPGLAGAASGSRYQFERLGYFCVDSKDSSEEALVFNRTVTLRDQWEKIKKAGKINS